MTLAEPFSLFIAIITKSYVSNGRPVINCEGYGMFPLSWSEVPVITFGGGLSDKVSHRPLPFSQPDNEFDVDGSEGAQAVALVAAAFWLAVADAASTSNDHFALSVLVERLRAA